MLTLLLTIIAHDVDYPREVFGHGLHLNISGTSLPRLLHGCSANYSLFAYRASIVEPGQISETVCLYTLMIKLVISSDVQLNLHQAKIDESHMNGMSARQILRALSR